MTEASLAVLRGLAAEEPLPLRVRGACMRSALHDGAVVRAHRKRLYLPGDVLVFRTPAGDLAAHRLLGYRLARGRFAFVTRGDHCDVHDAPVAPDAIIGAVRDIRVSLADRATALARFATLVLRRSFR